MTEYSEATQNWLDQQEGQQVPDAQGNKRAYCDSCAEPIQPGSDVQLYNADTSFHLGSGKDLGTLVTMALYGPECLRPRLMIPHEGTNEVLLSGEIDADGRIWGIDVVQSSPAFKGVGWDPAEVMEAVFKCPIEMWFQSAHTYLAPGDVADLLYAVGLDPREYVDMDTGEVTDDDDKLGMARYRFLDHMVESHMSGKAEQVFDKGDRQDEWLAEQVGLTVEELHEEGVTVHFDASEGEYVAVREDDDE